MNPLFSTAAYFVSPVRSGTNASWLSNGMFPLDFQVKRKLCFFPPLLFLIDFRIGKVCLCLQNEKEQKQKQIQIVTVNYLPPCFHRSLVVQHPLVSCSPHLSCYTIILTCWIIRYHMVTNVSPSSELLSNSSLKINCSFNAIFFKSPITIKHTYNYFPKCCMI